MTTNKQAASATTGAGEDATSEDLAAARARADDLEAANKRLEREKAKLQREAGHFEDVAARMDGEGRIGHFFRHMNRSVVVAASMAAGAAIGVGGTIMVKNRMNRTAVGATGHDDQGQPVDMA